MDEERARQLDSGHLPKQEATAERENGEDEREDDPGDEQSHRPKRTRSFVNSADRRNLAGGHDLRLA